MIDYEEELKKFEPCLDVADAEGAIYERELTDILDILQEVLREALSDLYDVALAALTPKLLKEDDFHGILLRRSTCADP